MFRELRHADLWAVEGDNWRGHRSLLKSWAAQLQFPNNSLPGLNPVTITWMRRTCVYRGDPDDRPDITREVAGVAARLWEAAGAGESADPFLCGVLADALEDTGEPPDVHRPFRDHPRTVTAGNWLFRELGLTTPAWVRGRRLARSDW